MNPLTYVLPGVREVRTPLAVGWAWLVIGWLLWPLVSNSSPFIPFQQKLPSFFSGMGGARVLTLLSIVAYLVGIAMEPFQNLTKGLIHRISEVFFMGLMITPLIFVLRDILHYPLVLLPFFVLALLVYLAGRRFSRFGNFLSMVLMDGLVPFCREFFEEFVSFWRRGASHEYHSLEGSLREYVVERVDDVVGSDERRIDPMVRAVTDDMLMDMFQELLDLVPSLDEKSTISVLVNDRTSVVSVAQIHKSLRNYWQDDDPFPAYLREMAEVLIIREMIADCGARKRIYSRFMDLSKWTMAVFGDVRTLSPELKVKSMDLYQDWNRLSSEGEFRTGISIPLWCGSVILLVQALALNGFHSHLFSVYNWDVVRYLSERDVVAIGNQVIGVVALVFSMAIYRNGNRAYMAANDLIMASLKWGILSPSPKSVPQSLEGIDMRLGLAPDDKVRMRIDLSRHGVADRTS